MALGTEEYRMARSRSLAYRIWAVAALLLAGAVTGVGLGPSATADVTAVSGGAFGYSANITLFGGQQPPAGPAPTVELPSAGSSTPLTGTLATAAVRYGPATLFTSNQVDVSTQGTTGPSGSVTSSATVNNVNTSGQEVFTAAKVVSTCTASESGKSASTTITGGRLIVSEGPNVDIDSDDVIVDIPANPSPGTTQDGKIETVNDTFQVIFNEQIVGSDGSITVNAVHLRLLGPTAVGDIIIGQSRCGVTAVAGTTTTTPTTTPGATTTTSGGGTTTTTSGTGTTTSSSSSTTSTTAVGGTTTTTGGTTGGTVSGGAFGFRVTVSLFGGPSATKGPEPTVTLPAGGSATPVTGSAASGIAQFGPATLYTSDALTVSTQGTPGGMVTSSAKATNINNSTVHKAQTGSESFFGDSVSSTCTSSSSGQTGSTNLLGARLVTSVGANFDSEADDVIVQIPADPAPNATYEGQIENVGDKFRIVFNEQERSAGSITVNAVHLYLLGPIANGDLIIGQSRCATTAGGTAGTGTGTGTGTAPGTGTATATGVAKTGNEAAVLSAFALLLVAVGAHVRYGVPGLRWAGAEPVGEGTRRRKMPWGRRRSGPTVIRSTRRGWR